MPLSYFEPNNATLTSVNDAYLWGENMLVAPVQEKGKTARTVYFPKGNWVNWWTGTAHADSAVVEAPLHQLPIFVKKGSFVPLSNPLKNTEGYTSQNLTIRYFAHESQTATFSLYEDDGKNPNALTEGAYELIVFKGIPGKSAHRLIVSGGKEGIRRNIAIELIIPGKGSKWVNVVYTGGKQRFVLN